MPSPTDGGASDFGGRPSGSAAVDRVVLVLLLLGGLFVRVIDFPGPATRDIDEMGYVQGGLMLAEGLTPTFKAAPGAPVVWLIWAQTMVSAGWYTLLPQPPEAGVSTMLRPYWGLNTALFNSYTDQSELRYLQLVGTIAAGLVCVVAAARLGHRAAGTAGAMLIGGVTAFAPLFVDFSLMTRPYIYGWAFALWAMLLAIRSTRFRSCIYAAVLLGLAVASRIEMLLLLPLLLWQVWPVLAGSKVSSGSEHSKFSDAKAGSVSLAPATSGGKYRRCVVMILIVAGVAYAAAPWLLTSLLTNLKSIVAVKLLSAGTESPAVLTTLRALLLDAGFVVIAFFGAVGLWRSSSGESVRRRVGLWVIAGLILLIGFRGSGYGLHQEGAMLVTVIVLAARGLETVRGRRFFGRGWLMPFVAAGSVVLLVASTIAHQRSRVPYAADPAVTDWVEQNISPGSELIWDIECISHPLPTVESADQLWRQYAENAWRDKYVAISRKMSGRSVSGEDQRGTGPTRETTVEPPRALSVDNSTKEFTNYRGIFILGSRSKLKANRYNYLAPPGTIWGDEKALLDQCLNNGGALVVFADSDIASQLGSPAKQLVSDGFATVNIYRKNK